LNPFEEVYQWERKEAVDILKHCGLVQGMTVLDLGCGEMHYSIPATIAVGNEGKVIAIDQAKKTVSLNHARIQREGITNIDLIHSDHNGLDQISDSSIDFLMLYDVIHTIPRMEVLTAIKHLLKNKGILSFLAFSEIRAQKNQSGHLLKSDQGENVMLSYDDALQRLIDEITLNGFKPERTIENSGIHFDHFHSSYHWKKYGEVRLSSLERGNIYNFSNIK
jgi:ubiquinone/menaquinone biosynthesis C-methylase UbiE